MRNLIFIGLITLALMLPNIAQNYDYAGMDFTKALYENKTPETRVKALIAYIKKYPDISNKFVQMAHYQLASNYFQVKNYPQTIKAGEKALKFQALKEGELGRLNLIIANSYGIKGSSLYNKGKALSYVNAAIKISRSSQDKDVLNAANNLKKQLSGTPQPKVPPLKKLKMSYSEEDYRSVVNIYNTLGTKDKNNPDVHRLYAVSLFKINQLDSALREFKYLYSKNQKGMTAFRIADVYKKKAKKNKRFFDSAVNYYLEAGLLFKKERNRSKEKSAFKNAKYQLYEKYDYNKKVQRLNKSIKTNTASQEKNKMDIIRLKRAIRKEERRIRSKYTELAPPDWEFDKINKYKKQMQALEKGGNANSMKQVEALEKEKQRIDKEYDDLYAKVKKRMEQK